MSSIYNSYVEYLKSSDEEGYELLNDHLLKIGRLIVKLERQDDEEFIYNVMDMIDKTIFPPEEEDVFSVEEKFDIIKAYVNENSIYSTKNKYQQKGYELIKKEEESFKLGTKGTRGITNCPRCKTDNIIMYFAQKRGLDEGESVFNTCVDCGNKWVVA